MATLDKILILKAAKRGFKSIYTDKDARNVDFATQSIKRMGGNPIAFIEKSLIKFDDFLFNGQVLNDTQHITKTLGSDNLRFLCNTVEDFKKNILIKEKCRKEGFADALDCKNNNPTLYETLCSTTEAPIKQAVLRTPVLIKYHIFNLMATSYSSRNIELILNLNVKISRSTFSCKDGLQKKGQESAKVLVVLVFFSFLHATK